MGEIKHNEVTLTVVFVNSKSIQEQKYVSYRPQR